MGIGLKLGKSRELLGDSLLCLNTSNHRKMWTIEVKDKMGRLFVEAEKVYFFDDKNVLNCLRIFDGKMLWRSDPLSKYNVSFESPHIVFEDISLIVYGSDLSKMTTLDKQTGKVINETSYVNLRSENRMPASVMQYKIEKSKVTYIVSVSDSLQNPEDYKQAYHVRILKSR